MNVAFYCYVALVLSLAWVVSCDPVSLILPNDGGRNFDIEIKFEVIVEDEPPVLPFMHFRVKDGALSETGGNIKISDGKYLFQQGDKSTINVTIVNNNKDQRNCKIAYIYREIFNTDLNQCGSSSCPANTNASRFECKVYNNIQWKLDRYGQFAAYIEYGPSSGHYLQLHLNFSVVNFLKVSYEPVMNQGCSNYELLQRSQMKFLLGNSTEKGQFFLSINGTVHSLQPGKAFYQPFNTLGHSTVKIFANHSIWELNVTVVKLVQKYVTYTPNTNNFSTNQVVTVSLVNNNTQCVHFNETNVRWSVNVAGNSSKTLYNRSKFNHTFQSIGPRSKGAVISVNYAIQNALILYPQLYDPIQDFGVSSSSYNQSCAVFKLMVEAGSSVGFSYSYNDGKETELDTNSDVVQSNTFYAFKIPLKSIGKRIFVVFFAKNPVSSIRIEWEFTSTELVILLEPSYYRAANENVTIVPKFEGLCEQFKYQWSIDTNSLSQNNYLEGDGEHSTVLTYNFTDEKRYDITVNILNGISNLPKSNTAFVHVRNKIKFSLPEKPIVLQDGKTQILKPNFTSKSTKEFQYRWVRSGYESKSRWINSTDLGEIKYNVTPGNWNLTLTIKNQIFNMSQTVQIISKTKRKINVNISVDSPYCNTNFGHSISGFCEIHDNHPSIDYTVDVSYGYHVDNKFYSSNRVDILGVYTETGSYEIYCFVKNVNAEQSFEKFTFVFTENITATISNTSFLLGESVSGKVANAKNTSTIPYKWYIKNVTGIVDWKQIQNGSHLSSYQFPLPGHFVVSVAVDLNGNDGCHQEWPVFVHIPLDLTVVPVTHHYNTSAVVTFNTVIPSSIAGLPTAYRWYVNGTIKSHEKGSSIFLFQNQGVYIVLVEVDVNGVNNTVSRTIYVEEPLNRTDIKAYYGSNEIIPNSLDHVPSNVHELDLYISVIPSNIRLFFHVQCRIEKNTDTFFNESSSTKHFQLNIRHLSGKNISCMVRAFNNVSSVDAAYRFIIAKPGTPSLFFVNPTTPVTMNSAVKVKLEILQTSVDTTLQWWYNQTMLKHCEKFIRASSSQLAECIIYVMYNSTSELEVILQPNSSTSGAVSKSIHPVRLFAISPTTVQVGQATAVKANITGSQLLYLWNYKNFTERQIEFRESVIGAYHIRVTIYNPISTATLSQKITVVDANNYRIISIEPHKREENLSISVPQRVKLSIENSTEDIEYLWNLSLQNVNYTILLINSKSLIIHFHEISAALVEAQVEATAKLNGINYGPKHFAIQVYKRIVNLQHTLTLTSLLPDNEYQFNVTWDGSKGVCKLNIKVENVTDNFQHRLIPFDNHCTVYFKTISDFNNTLVYVMDIKVSNPGSDVERTWKFKATPKQLDIDSRVEFIVNKTFHFEVKNDYENATYTWYLTKANDIPFRYLIGYGKSYDVSFPDNVTAGDYVIIVEATIPGVEPIQTKFNVRMLPTDVVKHFQVLEYPSGSTVRKNSTIRLEVDDPRKETEYIWYFMNNTTKMVIGNGSTVDYVIPPTVHGGNHTFKVIATGPLFSGERVYLYFFTFCGHTDPYFVFGDTRTHTMSQWFYSEVKLDADCSIAYSWLFKCFHANDSKCIDGKYRSNLTNVIEPMLNNPTLAIAPRYFAAGKYNISVEMRVGSMIHPLIITEEIIVTVHGTPLVPAISGGVYRVIGDEQTIHLNAGGTIDPDISFSDKPNLLYKWNISSTNSRCYVNKNNSTQVDVWSSDNEVITIRPGCLISSKTYHHTVHAKRFTAKKESKTSQEIYVIRGKAPLVQIECYTCKAFKSFKYTQNRKMKLYTTCSNCDNLPTTYTWEITGLKDKKLQRLEDNTSPVLVLPEYALAENQAYEIKVSARIQGMASEGSTKFTLGENTSPSNGTCDIHPISGEALVTEFKMNCSGWVDIDNTQQPFIYWLVAFSEDSEKKRVQTVLFRGILRELVTKLPVGDKNNNNSLQVQIWIQDSLGAYTVGYDKNLMVKPSYGATKDPIGFIKGSVLPDLEKNVDKKDLNQVTASVIGASTMLSFGGAKNSSLDDESQNSEDDIVDTLISSTAGLDATSVETIEQILSAFTAVSDNTKSQSMKGSSRDILFTSLEKMVNLSSLFTNEGLSLKEAAYDSFINLLGSNIKFDKSTKTLLTSNGRKRRSTVENNVDNVNYDLLQRVYVLALRTTIKGENPKLLKGPYITTNLQRRAGNMDRTKTRTVGTCSVSYNIDKVKRMDEVIEIVECSSVNPYEAVENQHSMVSLSLMNHNFIDLQLRDLPGRDINVGIPAQIGSTDYMNLSQTIGPEDILWAPVVNLTEPDGGWNHSAIHIVVDVFRAEKNVYLHLSKGKMINGESRDTVLKQFRSDNEEAKRTVTIAGIDYYNAYLENTTYYFGIDHDFVENITINVTVYITTCRFWNATMVKWEGTGCYPSEASTRQIVVCLCNHLTSFGSNIDISPNELDFSVLKKLNVAGNPIALATCLTVLVLYFILLIIAVRKDRVQTTCHVIPFIGSDEGFYHYEIRMKTGIYPWAGTSANVGLQIFGTSCTTKVRVMKGEDAFQRNSLDIFRISVDRSIGKIYKIRVWHDDTGTNPSWYLQRVVIRSLVNGEKFFFFCNRWIGTDCEDGELEHDFHVADTQEMQKFSTIFYDVLGRGFNDYHLWLSLFEKPKFSKFTCVQRLTCIFTFIYTWMAVNAMWFQVAPEGQVDLYIGFKGFSYEEIIIGLISALMVFPLNLLFFLLFRKSREKEVPAKPLKVWKEPRRVLMSVVNLDGAPLLEKAKEASSGFQFGDSSILQRGKKHLDVHKLIEQFDDNDSEEFHMFPRHGDALVQRTYTTVTAGSSSTSTNHILTLPHSFDSSRQAYDNPTLRDDYGNPTKPWDDYGHLTKPREDYGHLTKPRDDYADTQEPITLKMSSQHQYRTSSMSFPKRSDFKDNLVKETVKRTQSADSYNHLFSNEERRLLKTRLSTDELRSHMTDIVEQQLSNLVYTTNIHGDSDGVAFLSDYTNSRGEHHDTKLLNQIQKNEQLAAELQIPEIVELDPCTRWSLPYWCTYIGFICCFLVSAFCIVVVLIYGQQFGREKALKWLQALLFGCLEDFFLAYPFILLIVAAFLGLIVKPLDLDQIDHYDFVTCPSGNGQPINGENIFPPTGSALESAKREGQKRKEGRRYAKDVILQLFLLWLVISICTINFANKHPALYQFMDVNDALRFPQHQNQAFTRNLSKQQRWVSYWSWLDQTLIPTLYDRQQLGTDNVTQVWLFASTPYIRQVRVTKRDCPAKRYASLLNITRCNSVNYQRASFSGEGWDENSTVTIVDGSLWNSPWTFDKRSLSQDVVNGMLDHYPPQGYYIWLPKDITYKENMQRLLNELKRKLWIDGQTRLLQHTAVLYNPNINIYAYYNLLVETLDSHYTTASFSIDYFTADFYVRNIDRFSFFCVAVLTLILIGMSWTVVKMPFKHGWASFKRFWYLHLTATVIITLSAIILHVVTLVEMSRFDDIINNGDVAVDANVHEIAYLNNISRNVFAISAFLVVIRSVRLISWSGIYKLSSKVFAMSTGSLFSVVIFHILVVITFSHFGFLLFQGQVEGFHTFRESFLSTMLYRWWKPGPRETIQNERGFGMFWNILYMMYWLFILVNLFRAVMMNGRRLAKDLDRDSFWTSLWRTYVRRPTKKQCKRVHFSFEKKSTRATTDPKAAAANHVQYEEKEAKMEFEEEKYTTGEGEGGGRGGGGVNSSRTSAHLDLPQLPYSTFELNSNLISALAGLDKMISDDVWEEEMFSRFEKYYHRT